MGLSLVKKGVKRNYRFVFRLGEIIVCLYVNENNLVEREKMMIIGEWGKIYGSMFFK